MKSSNLVPSQSSITAVTLFLPRVPSLQSDPSSSHIQVQPWLRQLARRLALALPTSVAAVPEGLLGPGPGGGAGHAAALRPDPAKPGGRGEEPAGGGRAGDGGDGPGEGSAGGVPGPAGGLLGQAGRAGGRGGGHATAVEVGARQQVRATQAGMCVSQGRGLGILLLLLVGGCHGNNSQLK